MEKFKEILLGALLLIFLFIGLSASKERAYPTTWRDNGAEIVMHPAQPKAILAKSYNFFNPASEVARDINIYAVKGYIVKSSSGDGKGNWLLVMEKY